MQTFKTAIVVVLLLTVMYWAYESLTPPPNGSSGESEIRFTGLDSFDTDTGVASLPAFNESSVLSHESSSTPENEYGVSQGDQAYSSSDQTEELVHDHQEAGSTAFPENLPKPDSKESLVELAPNSSTVYSRTNQSKFELPDPYAVTDLVETPQGVEFTAEAREEDMEPTTENPIKYAEPDSPIANGINPGLANAILTADNLIHENRLKAALEMLSLYYDNPDLNSHEREQLLRRLDPLAGEVIYSQIHLLEKAYRVGDNESLMDVAKSHNVPWQLLAKINGLEHSMALVPGYELKVVSGPFNAQVNLTNKEITLFLNKMYAGRFSIQIGQDPAPQPGTYTIQGKQLQGLSDSDVSEVIASNHNSLYRGMRIELGQHMYIHGVPNNVSTIEGCIGLVDPHDADDVHAILGKGSTVTIRR